MVQKIFTDDSGFELTVQKDGNNMCEILIQSRDDEHMFGMMTLNADDLTELIKDLEEIKKNLQPF